MEANLAAGDFSDIVALTLVALNRNIQVHFIHDSVITLKDVIPVHYQGEEVWVKNLEKGDQVIIEAINQPVVGIKAQSY